MKIKTRTYIQDLRKAYGENQKSEFKAIRRAVDKYSDTTDEWKSLHNGLQRQMAEQGKNFVTKGELSQLVKMVWAVLALVAVLVVTVYVKK